MPEILDEIINTWQASFEAKPFIPVIENAGSVSEVGDGVALVRGLSDAFISEVLSFEGGIEGFVLSLAPDYVGVVLLGEDKYVREGDRVSRTGRLLSIPYTQNLIGRVIDPLGNPIDGKPAPKSIKFLPLETKAPSVIEREPVHQPMQTGIKTIDALFPIGRGQRELIIGDRQTGKTAIAIDTILNQKDENVICIYWNCTEIVHHGRNCQNTA